MDPRTHDSRRHTRLAHTECRGWAGLEQPVAIDLISESVPPWKCGSCVFGSPRLTFLKLRFWKPDVSQREAHSFLPTNSDDDFQGSPRRWRSSALQIRFATLAEIYAEGVKSNSPGSRQ